MTRTPLALVLTLAASGAARPQDSAPPARPDPDAVARLAADYAAFLGKARTELATVREAASLARAAGTLPLPAGRALPGPGALPRPGARFLLGNRDRALVLVTGGRSGPRAGLRIVAAHADSPRIDLKARPLYEREGFALFQTIYHGGIRSYQWANVPLALTGRVVLRSGEVRDIEMGLAPGDPVLVIPAPAPHEDKNYRERKLTEVLTGEELDPIVAATKAEGSVSAQAEKALSERWGLQKEDFVSAELALVPATAPRAVGLDRALLGGYGQDDRLCCYAGVRAWLDLPGPPAKTALVYLVDNEETGSVNNTGATSRFLRDVVARLVELEDPASFNENRVAEALAATEVLSADTTTAVNPLFADTQEHGNAARVGGGVVIKRYGRGSDANAEFLGKLRALLLAEAIPFQTHTYKVDVGGGGTIGMFLAQENMEVADVGVGILSMHSPFEVASVTDLWWFTRFCGAFLAGK